MSWEVKISPLLKKGSVNLLRHIENIKQFGVPVIVAINHFVTDTDVGG
jgi:formate--tetrahydrofolate ligase